MNTSKSKFELIESRKSERSFSKTDMNHKELDLIINDINEFKGPFKDTCKVELIINNRDINSSDEKLGTYGVIKGAKYYLGAVANRSDQSLFEIGYVVEKSIIYLLDKGIGTCWLGGTFQRGKFGEKVSLEKDEYLPIVIPFGYPKAKSSITDKVVRLVASSDKRKPWEELFFNENTDTPLLKELSPGYELALEAIRLAPSASNKQPWRIIRTTDGFEFYLKPTPGYSDKLSFNIQQVDIGIAMCHFELVAQEEGEEGRWEIKLEESSSKSDLIHVATWKIS